MSNQKVERAKHIEHLAKAADCELSHTKDLIPKFIIGLEVGIVALEADEEVLGGDMSRLGTESARHFGNKTDGTIDTSGQPLWLALMMLNKAEGCVDFYFTNENCTDGVFCRKSELKRNSKGDLVGLHFPGGETIPNDELSDKLSRFAVGYILGWAAPLIVEKAIEHLTNRKCPCPKCSTQDAHAAAWN